MRSMHHYEVKKLVDDLVYPLTLQQWYCEFKSALNEGDYFPDAPVNPTSTIIPSEGE